MAKHAGGAVATGNASSVATAKKTALTSKPAKRVQPPLAIKKHPEQQRATETYERILAVTAQTLVGVGIERLSTNLVCEPPGLTPFALYRYFPNTYVLPSEPRVRLMERENELIPQWIALKVLRSSVQDLERALCGRDLSVVDVFEQERTRLMPMPTPFDGYVERAARVSSTCLVMIARNRY